MKSISLLLSPLSPGLSLSKTLAARLRRSRPGSVLIIVIVLLLLLAILGAAYISTTRSARVASAQNVLNSDVDDMLHGISKVCEGVIVDDLNDTFGDLRGNTANTNNTGATAVVNRSIYQGQGEATPPTSLNVAALSPGDMVNDYNNIGLFVFDNVPQSGGAPIAQNGHLPITAIGGDPWLADRIADPAGLGKGPIWTSITQTISQANPPAPLSILGTPFVDPTTGADITSKLSTSKLSSPLIGAIGTATPTPLTPTSLPLANGFKMPALEIGTASTVPAADADGDGIADSLFFTIPGASYDGLTWYAAVRIIDNNSAINANTAWSRDNDYTYTFTGNPPTSAALTTPTPANIWNLFQTSVGLQEMINMGDFGQVNATPNLDKLNAYRFNDSSTAAGHPWATYDPFDESAIGPTGTVNAPPQAFDRGIPTPTGDTPAFSTQDHNFSSEGEALYQQLIRKIANPGYNSYGVGNPPVSTRYQAFPLSDEAALAYHFCLQNPNSMAQSVLESVLPNSLDGTGTSTIPSTPYDPSNATTWYTNNFNYPTGTDAIAAPMSLRPLLVTRNPVSNYIEQVYNNAATASGGAGPTSSDPILANYMLPYGPNTGAANPHYRGLWTATPNPAYGINDIVIYRDPALPNSPGYTFIAVAAPGATAPGTFSKGVPTAITNPPWKLQPWPSNPVKANVNTATFPELFRAFWCVMAGNPSTATPFGWTAAPGSIYGDTGTGIGNPNAQHEFRSPLRDPTTTQPSTATQLDPPPGSGIAPATATTSTSTNTMLLRAAMAAVNTLGLRDNSQNIISKTFLVNNAFVPSQSSTAGTPVEIRVFSNAPQPFITEVYFDNYNGFDPTNQTANLSGYIAIELFNPYSVPLLLNNWQVAYINRPTGAANPAVYPNLSVTSVGALTNDVNGKPIVIQPLGYALLENYNPNSSATTQPSAVPTTQPTDATYRSTNSGIVPEMGTLQGSTSTTQPATTQPATVTDVYVPGLSAVYGGGLGASPSNANPAGSNGGELVLLRPRRADGTYTSYTDPANGGVGGESFNEGSAAAPNLYDLVPVDSFDFTGFPPAPIYTVGSGWEAWSYIRSNGSTNLFKATYPGLYDAGQTLQASPAPRQNGTDPQQISSVAMATGYPSTSGSGGSGIQWTIGDATPVFFQTATSSYVYYENTNSPPPVQIYNVGAVANGYFSHFPNSPVAPDIANGAVVTSTPPYYVPAATPLYHPLGGFARNGDMLDIPFIGACRVRVASTAATNPSVFLEMNSLPSDCQAAAIDDQTVTSTLTPAENIGRFMPMAATAYYAAQIAKTPGANLQDYYAWTRNLFNYLTVQSSTDAYLPNFDPNLSSSNYTGTPTFAYPPQNGAAPVPPTPTLTSNATASDQTLQDNVGIEGLININTASWKVLSMLPFVSPLGAGGLAAAQAADRQIAQNIVNYRLTYGPFMSIFDLNQVPGFQSGTSVAWTPPGLPTPPPLNAPTSALGLITPPDPLFPNTTPVSSNVAEDYQWDTLTLTRISNLITTRSDTFTVYIEVQGWQNVGLPTVASPTLAQPMITRRYAFIVDRSAINGDPNTRFLKTLTVPND